MAIIKKPDTWGKKPVITPVKPSTPGMIKPPADKGGKATIQPYKPVKRFKQ